MDAILPRTLFAATIAFLLVRCSRPDVSRTHPSRAPRASADATAPGDRPLPVIAGAPIEILDAFTYELGDGNWSIDAELMFRNGDRRSHHVDVTRLAARHPTGALWSVASLGSSGNGSSNVSPGESFAFRGSWYLPEIDRRPRRAAPTGLIVRFEEGGYGPFEASTTTLPTIATGGLTMSFDASARIGEQFQPPQPPVPGFTKWVIRSSVFVENRSSQAVMLVPSWFAVDTGSGVAPALGGATQPRRLAPGESLRHDLHGETPTRGAIPRTVRLLYGPRDGEALATRTVEVVHGR